MLPSGPPGLVRRSVEESVASISSAVAEANAGLVSKITAEPGSKKRFPGVPKDASNRRSSSASAMGASGDR